MDWQTVRNNWPAFLEPIQQRWPETEENDLIEIDGNRDRFTEYLAELTGMTKNATNEEIEAWLVTHMPTDVRMNEFRDNKNIRESGRNIPPGEDVYSDDGRFGSGDWDDEGPANPVGRTK